MGDDSGSTNFENTLYVSDTRAINSQLNDLFMGVWLVSVVEIIQLKALVTYAAKKSLEA
nr:hypothetical protein [Endozoicomonas montiporae]